MGVRKLVLLLSLMVANVSSAVGQPSTLNLNGQYNGFIQLSAGGAGRGASMSTLATGGSATAAGAEGQELTAVLDFGDLSKGDGNPVTAAVGLRLRSNTGFRVVASVSQFQTSSLRYMGKEVDSADGGSFIKLWLGNVIGTGALSNTAQVNIGPVLSAGTTLSSISRGPVTVAATPVLSGPVASFGGSATSMDNALEIPVFFSVPTGFELGPAEGQASGNFSFVVQFGAFGAA
jgi:hypothetical protein